jgi:hypothetical protein
MEQNLNNRYDPAAMCENIFALTGHWHYYINSVASRYYILPDIDHKTKYLQYKYIIYSKWEIWRWINILNLFLKN